MRLRADVALMSRHQLGVRRFYEAADMARFARQQAEILALIQAGNLDRARVLAAEHLLEFP